MDKNVQVHYTMESHVAKRDKEGCFYCRALNMVSREAYDYCLSCPLFGGFARFGGETEEPECWYFDLDGLVEEERTSQQEKQRIDGMIMAGLVKEFPDFLENAPGAKSYHLIEEAIQFAAVAHKGVTRKGVEIPYVAHVMETMMLVAHMTSDNEVIAAAALHDVVEDTEYTLEDIEHKFGKRVASLVAHETENKRPDQPKEATWKIRKAEQLEQVKSAPIEVKMIMLGDKLSNMRASLRDFRKDPDNLWNKFNMKDVNQQEWYYRSVAEKLSDLKDYPAYQEYVEILDEVFQK